MSRAATAMDDHVSGTRELLVLTAERLFAEHGIDGVSLRQINSAAGQRNLSATHYHFGSKEALIAAIYAFRMARVNERRMRMVEQVEAGGGHRDIRTLVECIVLPVAEEIDSGPGGGHYIRFLAQVIGHPQLDLGGIWSSEHATGLARVAAHIRRALPQVPPRISGQRIGLMWEQVTHALADRERLRATTAGVSAALFMANLVDVVTAGLTAPVGPATRRELARGARRSASAGLLLGGTAERRQRGP